MTTKDKLTGVLSFKSIKAISFDLDDTLYDNKPVIEQAYLELYQFLIQHFPAISKLFSFNEFKVSALVVKKNNPKVVDLNVMRRLHIQHVLTSSNCNYSDSFIDTSFNTFWQARQKVVFFPEAKNVLASLEKQFPLVALSNGNACIKSMGIGQYFQFSVSPQDTGKAKPDPSMYLFACDKLDILPEQLLHIGDKLDSDIEGANNAGCRSIWFNLDKNNTENSADAVIVNLQELLAINFL
ncbi:MAG: hypothetical protein COA74_11160 [Gammaproteobacteria bacterium]|nr:MAG: hypothetical protein COA74_11160 [Gammaproteobacteria bacterium]